MWPRPDLLPDEWLLGLLAAVALPLLSGGLMLAALLKRLAQVLQRRASRVPKPGQQAPPKPWDRIKQPPRQP